MNPRYDVAILGSGVVAHTLALLLARERLRVALLRQPAPPAAGPDIRAYALNQAAVSLLSDLRVWPEAPAVTPVRQMWVCEPDAERPGALNLLAPTAQQPLAWIVDVPALEQRLAQALPFQSGIDLVSSAPPAELTVICEGKHSRTRAQFGIEYEVEPYAHTAVAARLRCARAHEGVARQWFQHGEVLALLPMDGPEGKLVALVWSVPHERAAELLGLAAPAFAAAVAQACDHALGAMSTEGTPAGWPLQLSRARHWVRPGLALAGDAAHAMHPLAGQGLNMGLGDVAELGRVLREREYWRSPGDWRLLRRYERARRADFERMATLTDGLYSLFGHGDERVGALRRWGLRRFDGLTPLKHHAIRLAMGGPEADAPCAPFAAPATAAFAASATASGQPPAAPSAAA